MPNPSTETLDKLEKLVTDSAAKWRVRWQQERELLRVVSKLEQPVATHTDAMVGKASAAVLDLVGFDT